MPSSQGTSCSLIPREPDFRTYSIQGIKGENTDKGQRTTDDEERSHRLSNTADQ
ncbi:hypothetical protein PISMIDRAFT_142198 [Pisolithus microcarpus 441]|uniref:Uncharacterized protein n=1 Tax=Pisolithus microcarpus 441 TaxID=765257 RepID=A0A0C9ZEP4_9AGAM|nr:hypothetical protein PISMIDRAFT_142198 [Pisolithus microcarpus 441]